MKIDGTDRTGNNGEEPVNPKSVGVAKTISKTNEELFQLQKLDETLEGIKAKLMDFSQIDGGIASQKSVYELWTGEDKQSGLLKIIEQLEIVQKQVNKIVDKDEITKCVNNSQKEIKDLISNIKSLLSDITNKISGIKDSIKSTVENLFTEKVTKTIQNAVEETVPANMNKALRNTVVTSVSDSVEEAVKNYMPKDSDDKTAVNAKKDYYVWTAIFAILIVVSGIFMARGFLIEIENIALLKAAFSFVIISIMLIIGFNFIFSVFQLRDNVICIYAYYIITIISSVVAFGLSCAVLMG